MEIWMVQLYVTLKAIHRRMSNKIFSYVSSSRDEWQDYWNIAESRLWNIKGHSLKEWGTKEAEM